MKLRKSVALVAMGAIVTLVTLGSPLGSCLRSRGLIACAFQVDYWNDLVHGAVGRRSDVHSDLAYTARQCGSAGPPDRRFGTGVYIPLGVPKV